MRKKLSICIGAVACVLLATMLSACGGVSPASSDYVSSNGTSNNDTSSVTSSYTYSSKSYSASSYSNTYSSRYSTTSSRSKSSSGCGYKYSDGSVCGLSVGSNGNFCNYHYNELNDTYNDLLNGLNNLE